MPMKLTVKDKVGIDLVLRECQLYDLHTPALVNMDLARVE